MSHEKGSAEYIQVWPDQFVTDSNFVALSTGRSGNVQLEQKFLMKLAEMYHTFCDKQRDYGCGNISKFMQKGVLVRASDKIERLVNLEKQGEAPKNESVRDSWKDLATYGVIGLMCLDGDWPE